MVPPTDCRSAEAPALVQPRPLRHGRLPPQRPIPLRKPPEPRDRIARSLASHLRGSDAKARIAGLRNVVVFGRAVTNVLQNLPSTEREFDAWYEPHVQAMRAKAGVGKRRASRLTEGEAVKGPVRSTAFVPVTAAIQASAPGRSAFVGELLTQSAGGSSDVRLDACPHIQSPSGEGLDSKPRCYSRNGGRRTHHAGDGLIRSVPLFRYSESAC